MERAKELFEKLKNQGKSSIEEFIITRKAEELFLDFKRSADSGSGERLNVNDRNNLAKAISGFGNSEGGVIVWGIDCSRGFDGSDVATAEHPITNVRRFVSWLQGVISGCTVPPHTGVQNHPVEIDGKGSGFVVTYIPKSDHAPHQEIRTRKYYIRAGSDFVPIPHDVLAGMFGKRPQPKIKVNTFIYPPKFEKETQIVTVSVEFHICNDGGGVAENLFASVLAGPLGGPKCNFHFIHDDKRFDMYHSIICWSTISKRDVRLPPGGWLKVAGMELNLQPPIRNELKIVATVGCGNAPPNRFVFKAQQETVRDCYTQIAEPSFELEKAEKHKIVETLLGISHSSK